MEFDIEREKQNIIHLLECAYSGAKMAGDEEVMLRTLRAIAAFKADVDKDIFIEENLNEYNDFGSVSADEIIQFLRSHPEADAELSK